MKIYNLTFGNRISRKWLLAGASSVAVALAGLPVSTIVIPSQAWAACDPGTTGVVNCTGTDTDVTKSATGNISLIFRDETVTTGGVEVDGNDVASVSLSVQNTDIGNATINVSPITSDGDQGIYIHNMDQAGSTVQVNIQAGLPGGTVSAIGAPNGNDQGVYIEKTSTGQIILNFADTVSGTNGGIWVGGSINAVTNNPSITSGTASSVTINAVDVSGTGSGNANDKGVYVVTTGDAGDISITTTGTVSSNTSDGVVAIAQGAADVTIHVNDVHVGNNGGDDGIDAVSAGGAIKVTVDGTIDYNSGTAGDRGVDARNTGDGTIEITANSGAVINGGGASSNNSNDGIYASGVDGKITITTTDATVNGGTNQNNSNGIEATNSGTGEILVDAGIVNATRGTGISTSANSGNTTVNVHKDVTVSGAGNNGVNSTSVDGDIRIVSDADADIGATAGIGINASTSGNGDIYAKNNATVSGTQGIVLAASGTGTVGDVINEDVTGTSGDAVHTTSVDGATNITVLTGDIHSTQDGIDATVTGTGASTVVGDAPTAGLLIDQQGGSIGTDPGNSGTRVGGYGIIGTMSGVSSADLTINAKTIWSTLDGVRAQVTNSGASSTVTVNVNGGIDSSTDDGVDARNAGTGNINVHVNAGGSILAGNGNGDSGIEAIQSGTAGNVLVDTAAGTTVSGADNGIDARVLTGTGSVTVTTHGKVTARVGQDGDAIYAQTNSGAINVDVYHDGDPGTTDLAFGNNSGNSDGIQTSTTTGITSIGVHDGVTIMTPSTGRAGIYATSTGAGATIGVTIGNNVTIDPVDYGSNSNSAMAGVNTTIGNNNSFTVVDTDLDNVAIGIQAISGAADDTTPFDTINPDNAHSVVVRTGGQNTINVTGNSGNNNPVAGINAGNYNAAGSGSTVVALGIYNGYGDTITVHGNGDQADGAPIGGILTFSQGTGSINVSTGDASWGKSTSITVGDDDTDGTNGTTGDFSIGIGAYSAFDGSVNIDLGRRSNITVVDNLDTGVNQRNSAGIGVSVAGSGSASAGGNVTIDTGSHSHINVTGGDGINVYYDKASPLAMTSVTVGWRSSVIADYSAINIGGDASNGGAGNGNAAGTAYVYNYGKAVGSGVDGSGKDYAPVVNVNALSSITINNEWRGYIGNNEDKSLAVTDALAVATHTGTSGIATLNNWGTIVGRIDLWNNDTLAGQGTYYNTVNNYSSHSWTFTGHSDFGAGTADVFNNTGTVHNLSGTPSNADVSYYDDLEYFNNGASGTYDTGTIDLSDGTTNDNIYVNPSANATLNYYGYDGKSFFNVDTYLADPGTSASDRMKINGNVSGGTAVVVNDIGGTGAYNPDGITVVDVTGTASVGNFYLANGPITKGLWDYDMFLNAGNASGPHGSSSNCDGTDNCFVIASYANVTAYNIASLAAIGQNAWSRTSEGWIDRSGDLREYQLNGGASGPTGPMSMASGASKENGIWGRIIGVSGGRDQMTTVYPFPDQPVTFDTGYDDTLWGFQGGIDHSFATNGGGTMVIGLMGGYYENKVAFNSGNTAHLTGPTVGVYANWINGGTYIDALLKADFLNVQFDGQDDWTKGTSFGGQIEAGNRIKMANNTFIEPVASVAYVNTSFDSVDFYGTDVSFKNGDSLRAKIGARFGADWTNGNAKVSPYVGAFLGNEFMGDNTVLLQSMGPDLTVHDDVSGMFGEVNAGVNVANLAGNATVFASGSYIFGGDYSAGVGKGGVRFQW